MPATAVCSAGGSCDSTSATSVTPIGLPDDRSLEILELPAERLRPVGKNRYILSRTLLRMRASSNAASTLPSVCVVRHFAPDMPAADVPWCTTQLSSAGRAAHFISLAGSLGEEAILGLALRGESQVKSTRPLERL